MTNNPLVFRRTYNAPVEKIWDAITNIDKMKIWYMADLADFQPLVGFQTEFTVNYEGKSYPHLWKVLEVIHQKKISYEWSYKNYPGTSIVSFELEKNGDKTNLILIHSGLESFQPDKYPELSRENFELGWNSLLNEELVKFLE